MQTLGRCRDSLLRTERVMDIKRGSNCTGIWRRVFLAMGMACAKALRWEHAQCVAVQ